MIGAHGQTVRQLVIQAAKQEQEPVYTIQITLASHSPNNKVATLKNAVMTLGHRGVRLMVCAPIMVKALSKNKNPDRDTLKLRVQTLLKPKLD